VPELPASGIARPTQLERIRYETRELVQYSASPEQTFDQWPLVWASVCRGTPAMNPAWSPGLAPQALCSGQARDDRIA
jgi:hypothetical protein